MTRDEIQESIEDVIAPFNKQMESRSITFELVNNLPANLDDLEESYLANWDLLNQTVFHPFVNAVKFNKIRGSIQVSIKIKHGSGSRREA